MASFQTILFAATAALAGFVSAVPALGSDSSLVARCDCNDLPSILSNVNTLIAAVDVDLSRWSPPSPLAVQLLIHVWNLETKIDAAVDVKVDVAVVTPAIVQIKAIVEAAVVLRLMRLLISIQTSFWSASVSRPSLNSLFQLSL